MGNILYMFLERKFFTKWGTRDIIIVSKENVFPDPVRFFIVRYNSVENPPIKSDIQLFLSNRRRGVFV